MKTKLIIVLAAVAMLFTACTKDNTQTEAAVNTLVLEGKTYQLECSYEIDANGRSYAFGQTVDKDSNGEPLYTIIADVEIPTLNKTYDLANLPVDSDEIISFCIHDASWEFCPAFASGTLTISRTEELFTYKLTTGVTLDNMAVSFHISVLKAQWVQLQY